MENLLIVSTAELNKAVYYLEHWANEIQCKLTYDLIQDPTDLKGDEMQISNITFLNENWVMYPQSHYIEERIISQL